MLVLDIITEFFLKHTQVISVTAAFIIFGGIIIKVLTVLLHNFFERAHFDRTVEIFLERIFSVILWIVLILIILSNLGVDVTAFVAGLGVMGFVVGFATKDVFANLAAGLMIMRTRPFKVKDHVLVAGIDGIVKEINMSCCIVITKDNIYVTIPNVKIWGTPIKNFSRLKKNI